MRTVITVSIAVVVTVSAMLFAGDTNPPVGPVAGTMKTLQQVEPRTPIDSLPFTITDPGSYYLTGNLSTATNGIIVQASDVTIDLMGFTITGSDPNQYDGIIVPITFLHKNLSVRNGTVRTFKHGVLPYDGSNDSGGRVIDVRVEDIGSIGIWTGANNGLILNCSARLSASSSSPAGATGIVGFGTTIRDCQAFGGWGFGILANNGSVVEGCISRENVMGIFCSASVARGCVAQFNSQTGIRCDGSLVDGCIATNNTGQNLDFVSGSQVDNYAP